MAALEKRPPTPPLLPPQAKSRQPPSLAEWRERMKSEMIDRVLSYFIELAKPFYFMLLATEVRMVSGEEGERLGIPVAATDGERIFINEAFIERLNPLAAEGHIAAVVAHELLHIYLQHVERRGERDRALWNMATDAIINETLRGGPCDPTAVTDAVTFSTLEALTGTPARAFERLDAESIYALLARALQGGAARGGARGWGGDIREDLSGRDVGKVVHKPVVKRDESTPVQEWKESVLSRAIHSAGSEALGLKRLFENLIKRRHQVDWRTRLRLLLKQGMARGRRSFSRPHRRGVEGLPGRRRLDPLPIYVLVDTSGSISDDVMEQFAAEVYSIVSDVAPVYIIPWDTEAYGVFHAKSGREFVEVFRRHLKGGGGTDPIPALNLAGERVSRTGASAVIVLTDGYWSPSDEAVEAAIRSRLGAAPVLVAYTEREPELPGIERVKVEVEA